MTDRKYKLVWVPTEKADRSIIPFKLSKTSGKLVYKLPSNLSFGHLELNGVNVGGYFKPDDDKTEYTLRPWMFDNVQPEVTEEPEPEAEPE